MPLSLITYNVAGLQNPRKRRSIFYFLRQKKFDIICLQETHTTASCLRQWELEWVGEILASHGSTKSKGVAVLFSKKLSYSKQDVCVDNFGRYIIMNLEITDQRLTLCNVYGPNQDSPQFYGNLFTLLTKRQAESGIENCIISGDFNCVLNDKLDKTGGREKHGNRRAKTTILQAMNDLELYDVFRIKHPNSKQYTRMQKRPHTASRLDFVLATSEILQKTTQIQIVLSTQSDHCIVKLVLNLDKIPRGRGYWKMNTSLLEDAKFVENTKKWTAEFLINNDNGAVSPQVLWEALKCNIRGYIIKYASENNKKIKARQTNLENKLADLQNLPQPHDECTMGKIVQTQEQYDDIIESYSKSAIVRSRVRWAEYGGKNNAYFLNLEKRRMEKKAINRLNSNANIETDQQAILRLLKEYFETLYSSSNNPGRTSKSKIKEYTNSLMCPRLDAEKANECEGKLTVDKCYEALKTMQNNKSPGLDGFPAEFYKVFWKEINSTLVNAFNHAFEKGAFSGQMNWGVVTLIPKPEKDLLYPENYRPITLLNADYKIAAKAINNRIKNVLTTIIAPEQTGFIKGRYIGDNIRTLFNVWDHTTDQGLHGALLFLDIRKAFDSVNWDFVNAACSSFGFGKDLSRWIRTFYVDAKCLIINNNHMSTPFRVERGVRQGEPCSPSLFSLAIESLSLAIKRNKSVKGIPIVSQDIKISLFADDALLFLDGSEKSFRAAFAEATEFGNHSGCKINIAKSNAMYIGKKQPNSPHQLSSQGLSWPNTFIKYLGVKIPVNRNKTNLFTINFESIGKEIQAVTKPWLARSLSLLGRVTIIKALAIPKLLYKLSVLPVSLPKQFFKEIKRKLFTFLWGSNWERVGRKTLCSNIKEAGLEMIDLEAYAKSIRFSWIRKLLDTNHESHWKNIETKITSLNTMICVAASDLKLTHKEITKQTPLSTFWSSIELWRECVSQFWPQDKVYNCAIWLNKKVLFKRKPIAYENFIKSGILMYQQIIDNNSDYCSFTILCEKYTLTNNNQNHADYQRLIAAIPTTWETYTTDRPERKTAIDRLRKGISDNLPTAKNAYEYFVSPNKQKPTKQQNKWEVTLQRGPLNWSEIYKNLYDCTFETKLRSFQVKINLRAIVLNDKLHGFGIIETDVCTFCGVNKETIYHLFCECKHVQVYWESVSAWMDSVLCHKTIISNTVKLFGIHNDCLEKCVLNLMNCMLVVARFVIYKCRIQNLKPNIEMFIYAMNRSRANEKAVAIKHNKLLQYKLKWNANLR
uniref:Pol-like protein n=1 Tax=Ciona intestinalis TaxID=7719 RepID=Q76IK4_CIOIN|nr:pol-like protein [Ciona intestinalis]